MKNIVLEEYLIEKELDIDKMIDDYYEYVYKIVKNSVNISITNEDIEEIISDVFFAMWKNSKRLEKTIEIKPYLAGIAKNIVKNRYRNVDLNFSISDYEETIIDNYCIEEIAEQKDKDKIIQNTLEQLRTEEYKIFIMFYYESKAIKEIATILNLSISNVKTILHRVRKIIKIKLEDGGYGYGR